MYEHRYTKYITDTTARFADEEEIIEVCEPITREEKSDACGALLYYDNEALYVDNSDAHYYILGKTGCKKSRIEGINTVKSVFKVGESVVINDPKGELYRKTANYARLNGYNIDVLNMRDTSKSHGWNPMMLVRMFEKAGDTAAAEQALCDFKNAMVGPALSNTVRRHGP